MAHMHISEQTLGNTARFKDDGAPNDSQHPNAQIAESYILGHGLHLPVPLASDHAVAYLRAKTITMNLIFFQINWSGGWRVSVSARCEIRLFPMCLPSWVRWASDKKVAYFWAKTNPMNLIWSQLAQWLLDYGIRKVQQPVVWPMGQLWRDRRICDHNFAHLQDKKISVDLIWMGLSAPNPVSGPVRCGTDGRNDVGKTRDTNGVIKKWTLATNQCHFGLLGLLVMCFDDVYLISYYMISKYFCW